MSVFCQYAIHVILISSLDIRVRHASYRKYRCAIDGLHCHYAKCLLRDPSVVARSISRNRPYIGGHLAFYFKLNSKLSHKILKMDLNVWLLFLL